MDPLSVMASVVGLLTAAGTVTSILSTVKSSISDTPRLIDRILSEVKEVEISLSAVHRFLLGIRTAPIHRIAMIQLDHLIATLTESVLTFSELEALVKPLATGPKTSILERIKWAWKEDAVSGIMQRLERHKSSFSLMLNIAQWYVYNFYCVISVPKYSNTEASLSESDLEAVQSQDTLQDLIKQLLEGNQDVSRRLRNLEDMCETRSVLTHCFRNNSNAEEVNDSAETIRDNLVPEDANRSSNSFPVTIFQFSFEADLNTSRVYKRTSLYQPDASFTSSAIRAHAWSIFSGLSLSEVSMISAIALPLYSHDISNSQWYNFGESSQPGPQNTTHFSEGTSPTSRAGTGVNAILDSMTQNFNIGSASIPPTPGSPSQAALPSKSATGMPRHKLVIIGDRGVGKEALTRQEGIVLLICFVTNIDNSCILIVLSKSLIPQ
jgi:hypothetical protein